MGSDQKRYEKQSRLSRSTFGIGGVCLTLLAVQCGTLGMKMRWDEMGWDEMRFGGLGRTRDNGVRIERCPENNELRADKMSQARLHFSASRPSGL